MSQVVRLRRGGKANTVITGTLTGSGSLAIPQGVILATLIGRGANGDNSYYSDPGQPYIAPTVGNSPHGAYGVTTGTCADTPGSWGPTNVNTFDMLGGAGMYTSWDCPYSISPGQPYIAPSTGGGPYTGASTAATLNGVTGTWVGGYDSGGVGPTSTKTLVSTGAGQTMTYVVPGTGALSYSYEY